MNRRIPLAPLLLALLALPAAGQAPARRDIADFGASPTASPATNRKAIQAAIDAGPGIVTGTGSYATDRTLRVDATVGLDSDRSWTIRPAPFYAHDLVAVGIARRPQGRALTPEHVVPITDLFDAQTRANIGQAGPRFGLRTMGDCHFACQGTFLDMPPGWWEGAAGLTAEWAMTLPARLPDTSASIMGMSFAGRGEPWWIVAIPGTPPLAQLRLHLASGPLDDGRELLFSFPIPQAPSPLARLAVQVDLAAGAVIAFADGLQVPVRGPAIPPGSRLAANQHAAFGLGSTGGQANWVADAVGGPYDATFCGLKVSTGPVYADDGPGRPQRRLDGQTANDWTRYFSPIGRNTAALLPLTQDADDLCSDRLVRVHNALGSTLGNGYFLDNALHGHPNSNVPGVTVSGVNLIGVGRGLTWGGATNLLIRDVTARGMHAIGATNFGPVNFSIDLDHCDLSGADAGLYLYGSAQVTARSLKVSASGRASLRVAGSDLSLWGLKVDGTGQPQFVVWAPSSKLDASAVWVDFEGSGSPSVAAFYGSAPNGQQLQRFRVKDASFGDLGRDAYYCILDGDRPTGTAEFDLDSPSIVSGGRNRRVRVGPAWKGAMGPALSAEGAAAPGEVRP